jgi:hypothetical protein
MGPCMHLSYRVVCSSVLSHQVTRDLLGRVCYRPQHASPCRQSYVPGSLPGLSCTQLGWVYAMKTMHAATACMVVYK